MTNTPYSVWTYLFPQSPLKSTKAAGGSKESVKASMCSSCPAQWVGSVLCWVLAVATEPPMQNTVVPVCTVHTE